jgi:zinc/manganese transport system permease protein
VIEPEWLKAGAGALALAFGGAPLGVLLVARRMSLIGDGMSHAILPGAAVAYLLAGPDPLALTFGALTAGVLVAGLSSWLARTRRMPEDAGFAVFYLSALALGVLLIGREGDAEELLHLLFGHSDALDDTGLVLAAGAATATLVTIALFIRGFLADSADPVFMRASGLRGGLLHMLLMTLVALNLVAGFRAFGALMTVGLIMIPAAASRFWARAYAGQALTAAALATLAGGAGLTLAAAVGREPGPLMVLAAAGLFGLSGVLGPVGGWLQTRPGRAHLEG